MHAKPVETTRRNAEIRSTSVIKEPSSARRASFALPLAPRWRGDRRERSELKSLHSQLPIRGAANNSRLLGPNMLPTVVPTKAIPLATSKREEALSRY